jgi:hypothetical protein
VILYDEEQGTFLDELELSQTPIAIFTGSAEAMCTQLRLQDWDHVVNSYCAEHAIDV